MWTQIVQITSHLLKANFIRKDNLYISFKLEFCSSEYSEIQFDPDYFHLTQESKDLVADEVLKLASQKLLNFLTTIYHQMSRALFAREQSFNVFTFMNKFCQDSFEKVIHKILECLVVQFTNLPIFQKLSTQTKQQNTLKAHVLR